VSLESQILLCVLPAVARATVGGASGHPGQFYRGLAAPLWEPDLLALSHPEHSSRRGFHTPVVAWRADDIYPDSCPTFKTALTPATLRGRGGCYFGSKQVAPPVLGERLTDERLRSRRGNHVRE